MICEADVIERVELFVRHPVFEGSAGAMEDVLQDLESRAGARQISEATFHRLRDLIRSSAHFRRT